MIFSCRVWIDDLTTLMKRFNKWTHILRQWRRLSIVISKYRNSLRREFDSFRSIAKYWRKIANLIDENGGNILNLLTLKHIDCWLNIADRHTTNLIEVTYVSQKLAVGENRI